MNGQGITRPGLHVWDLAKEAFFRTKKTHALLHDSIASLVLLAFSFAIRMIMGVVVARLLGASNYGIYTYALAWLALLTIPTTLGLDHVTLRYVSAYKETQAWSSLKGVLMFASVVAVTAAIVVSLVSFVIVAFLPRVERDLRTTLWITLAILPMAVMTQVRQSSLRGLGHPVLAQIPENILYPAFLIAFLLGTHYVFGTALLASAAALANAGAWLAAFIIGTIFLMRNMPLPARVSTPTYERACWKKMMLPLVLSGGAYYIMSRGDVLVLGALGTTKDVGLYVAASRASEQLMMFMYTAVTLAGTSLFSEIYATGDVEELQRFTTLATRLIFWCSLPVYLVLMGIAPWFLSLFGQEFVAASSAMRFLLTTFFVSSFTGPVIVMHYMTGHQRDVAVVMGIMAAANVGLSFILIPIFGMMGAAISSGTILMLLHGTLAVVLYRRIGVVSLPFNLGRAFRKLS